MDQVVEVGLVRVPGFAGVDAVGGAEFGGFYELGVGAGFEVSEEGLFVFVVEEEQWVEVGAVVAAGAQGVSIQGSSKPEEVWGAMGSPISPSSSSTGGLGFLPRAVGWSALPGWGRRWCRSGPFPAVCR